MSKKIVITGATGLIGKKLASALIKRGDEVIIFSRDRQKAKSIFPKAKECVEWNYNTPAEWEMYLEDCFAVIHLAGTNVFSKRWNDSFKKEILESRYISTKNLVEAIGKSQNKPSIFISASGVGYYGDGGENLLSENSPLGTDFLAQVCSVWESESKNVEKYGIRRVSIRTGIVLSTEDGALKQMLTPFKLFIGGPLSNGKQWFPWIHFDDIVGIYLHALDNEQISGSINAVSPSIIRMKAFAQSLGKVLNRPSVFPVSKFVLKLVVGEASDVITASQKLSINKLLQSGFVFKFNNLETALRDLLK